MRPDGFPIAFSLSHAAEVTGISVSRLRSYIARDILKHVGQIPPAVPDETGGGRSYRPAKINDNHPSAQSGLKVLGLLNVTAVLAEIDAAVEAHLAKSPSKQ